MSKCYCFYLLGLRRKEGNILHCNSANTLVASQSGRTESYSSMLVRIHRNSTSNGIYSRM